MSTTVMITLPRNRESIEEVYLLQWMLDNDIHKWIIAKETGNDGYKHWQIRINTRYTFEALKQAFPKAHIEEASDDYRYERKEGNYIESGDTVYTLMARFGDLRENQNRIIRNLDTQSDRQIDVVCDPSGCTGKTHTIRALYNRGLAFFVPPTITDGKTIIQYVASGYDREPIIVVDVARSTRWCNALYVALETIKDGLVYDARYHTTTRDIHGVKVLVMCNTRPKLDKLSMDRWRLFDANGEPLT